MLTGDRSTFLVEIFEAPTPEAGIYTWDIGKNLVFADAALADLFGLDPKETVQGLPLETYLDRVHPGDRPTLAKIISQTIIAETPQQTEYRVQGHDGIYRSVVAFGRAFRDKTGTPILYSGIVVPANEIDDGGTMPH